MRHRMGKRGVEVDEDVVAASGMVSLPASPAAAMAAAVVATLDGRLDCTVCPLLRSQLDARRLPLRHGKENADYLQRADHRRVATGRTHFEPKAFGVDSPAFNIRAAVEAACEPCDP
jgi:hypothetical protein